MEPHFAWSILIWWRTACNFLAIIYIKLLGDQGQLSQCWVSMGAVQKTLELLLINSFFYLIFRYACFVLKSHKHLKLYRCKENIRSTVKVHLTTKPEHLSSLRSHCSWTELNLSLLVNQVHEPVKASRPSKWL